MGKDWIEWHAQYADPNSGLAHRLEAVRRELTRLLASHPKRLVSVCAGRGEDVLPVLAGSSPGTEAYLIETHPRLAAEARQCAAELDLDQVQVLERDAGTVTSYLDIGLADVLMLCGVFGNISDDDILRTIDSIPLLLAQGGHLIWSRSRRQPDITPRIRQHLNNTGLVELEFIAPADDLWSVGVNRLEGGFDGNQPDGEMFTFIV